MKQCPYCGNELADDAKFCVECGRSLQENEPVETPAEPEAPVQAPEAPIVTAPVVPVVVAPEEPERPKAAEAAPADMPVITEMPSKKQLLSTFQYILLTLLYALPVIGLIFLFIFGAGHPKNGSLKRYSAAMLILRLLFWIAVLALAIVAMVTNGRLIVDAVEQLIPAVENLFKAICH